MMRRVFVAALLLCSSLRVRAEDAPAPAPDLTRVQLLEEAPNYAQALADQWTPGVRTEKNEIDRASRNYGLLVENGQVQSITLEQCIALAVQNNTGLKVSYLDPISAAVGVRKARSIFDPEFYGDAGKTRTKTQLQSSNAIVGNNDRSFRDEEDWNLGVRKTLITGGLLFGEFRNQRISQTRNVAAILRPYYQTQLNLSLNQPLLRGFGWRYTLLLVDVAAKTEESAIYQYRASVSNLVKEVERAYWVFVLAIQNVKVEERGLELARELLRQNEGRYNVGAMPRTAVLEAQAEVAQREAQLVNSRNLLQNSRDRLRAVINARDPSSNLLLMVEPADAPTVVPYQVDLERSLKVAAAQRPELIAARLDVDAKRIQRKVAENEILPRLDLNGSIGLNGLGGNNKGGLDLTGTPNDTSDDIQPFPSLFGGYERSLHFLTDGDFYHYAIGAQLEVPIANAQAKADVAQAKIDTERSWLSLHQLEENVTLEVKTAVSNLDSDLKSIEATRIARELAEENLRNQKARYDVGLATTKDIVDYQDRLTQAQRQEIIALTTYNTDLAELRRVEGTLLDARNVVVEHPEPEKAPWWARF